MSPWIQENRDLQSGRIPLVLESVGGVQKRLHNEWQTGLSGPRNGELQGKGLERWKPPLYFLAVKHLETLEVRLDHSGLFNTTVEP